MSLLPWSSIRCAVVVAGVVAMGVPVAAQDRLFLDGYEVGAHGRLGERLAPANGLDSPLVGGGRFAVLDDRVVDLRTGAWRPLPPGAAVAALDPARPRLFVALPGTGPSGTLDLAVFDAVSGAVEGVATGVCQGTFWGTPSGQARAVFAYATQVAFVTRCSSLLVPVDMMTVDLSAHPWRERILPIAPPSGTFEVSADATRLFVSTITAGAQVLTAYDVDSGALVGRVETGGEMRWADAIDGLIVVASLGNFDDDVLTAFGPNLERLGALRAATRICRSRVQISPHTGRVYVTTGGSSNTFALPLRIAVFDDTSLGSSTAVFPRVDRAWSCLEPAVRTAPGAPRDVRAVVEGRDVTVAWRNVGAASHFVIEAGVAPGRTDLSFPLGPESSITFANVPPGTYYVRVRGGNEFGGGRPSQELSITVR